MIEHTFCHINGVGKKTEARLWDCAIHTWEDFSRAPCPPIGRATQSMIRAGLAESREFLLAGRVRYFFQGLPPDQQWRLFGYFRGRTAYLDIETSGLSRDSNRITTIAVYDGTRIRCYINGQNLHCFPDDIARYDLLVTYNGKSFDIPFIERFFGIRLNRPHIDLRHVFHSLGVKGGLKGCEKQFGIDRRDLEGMDGFFAVLLWNQYERTGDPRFLETLLAYNIEDTVNLEYLMHAAYNLKLSETPFAGSAQLCLPDRPAIPYACSPWVLDQMKGRFSDARIAAGVCHGL